MGSRRKHLLCFTDLNTDLAGSGAGRMADEQEKKETGEAESRQNKRKSSSSKQFCVCTALGMSRVLTRNQWMLLVGSSSLRINHKTMPTGGQVLVKIVCLKRPKEAY